MCVVSKVGSNGDILIATFILVTWALMRQRKSNRINSGTDNSITTAANRSQGMVARIDVQNQFSHGVLHKGPGSVSARVDSVPLQ